MSETAAQKVFGLLDLMEIICEHTSERGPDGEFLDKKPLRSLAMVNHVARQSAFRRLWRNINGLAKLVNQVPEGRKRIVTRTKQAPDADKFFFFTDMVHSFHAYPHGDAWHRFGDLLQFVEKLPADRPLFPNLQDLGLPWVILRLPEDKVILDKEHRRPPQDHWTNALSVFPPQNVRRLSLHLGGADSPEHAPWMASIGSHFPLLTTLDISNCPIGSEWETGISAGVRAIPNLRKLEVNITSPIITALIADLKYLRALRTLHIELYSGGILDSNARDKAKNHVSDSRYPASSHRLPLDVFLTGHNNVGQVSTVVSALGANRVPLASLSVIMDWQKHTKNPLMPITELVASTYPSISHFTLQYYNLPTDVKYSLNLSNDYYSLLIPLLPLSNIVELDLRASGTMVIDTATLHSIPDHWPLIQHCHFSLEVRASETSPPRTPPQLLDVVQFASKCQFLKTLGIVLDARVPSAPEEIQEMSSRTLSTLNVGASRIDHNRYAAMLIRTAFPFLVDLMWEKEVHPQNLRLTDQERATWKSVHRLVFSPVSVLLRDSPLHYVHSWR